MWALHKHKIGGASPSPPDPNAFRPERSQGRPMAAGAAGAEMDGVFVPSRHPVPAVLCLSCARHVWRLGTPKAELNWSETGESFFAVRVLTVDRSLHVLVPGFRTAEPR